MRRNVIFAVALAAALLTGCGGSSSTTPSGTPDNPVPARQQAGSEAPATAAPDYNKLLERQKRKPGTRFTPCNLVTKDQARAIIGAPISEPVEAPLGPTCIYRSQDGKAFVTIAMPSARYSRLRSQSRTKRSVTVLDRQGFCGGNGTPTLYLPVARRRVLTVAAPCPMAQRFAAMAVRHLDG